MFRENLLPVGATSRCFVGASSCTPFCFSSAFLDPSHEGCCLFWYVKSFLSKHGSRCGENEAGLVKKSGEGRRASVFSTSRVYDEPGRCFHAPVQELAHASFQPRTPWATKFKGKKLGFHNTGPLECVCIVPRSSPDAATLIIAIAFHRHASVGESW
ncbi:unnamed protein product [Scytosiphon promiscuus]